MIVLQHLLSTAAVISGQSTSGIVPIEKNGKKSVFITFLKNNLHSIKGSLILGADQNTKNVILKVDIEKIQAESEQEAEELLEEIKDVAGEPTTYEKLFKNLESSEDEENKEIKRSAPPSKSQKVIEFLQNENSKGSKNINKKDKNGKKEEEDDKVNF